MRKYELSLAADRDLDDIYTYTFREFGVLQADAYFESLQGCLITLGDNPLFGVDASNLRVGYLRFVHQRHMLYYKKSKPGIRVIRILGPGMSIERAIRK